MLKQIENLSALIVQKNDLNPAGDSEESGFRQDDASLAHPTTSTTLLFVVQPKHNFSCLFCLKMSILLLIDLFIHAYSHKLIDLLKLFFIISSLLGILRVIGGSNLSSCQFLVIVHEDYSLIIRKLNWSSHAFYVILLVFGYDISRSMSACLQNLWTNDFPDKRHPRTVS